MLDPSKEIKEGYQSFVATTKSGLTFTGLKVAQNGKELILKDSTGKEVRIAAGDLDEVKPSKTSLMPDDVVRHLNIGEFLDLVSFLRDRKSQEELRGMVLTAWAIGPVEFDLTKATPLEMNPDPDKGYINEDKLRLSWRQVHADISGKGFDLRGIVGKDPASAYVLTYVYSPKEQKVQLQLQSDEKLRLWHNGKRVEPMETTPLTLVQGWNTLLARLNNEQASPFLSARILGGEAVRVALQKE
jgi:quinoprotein glucose dehydrogenase